MAGELGNGDRRHVAVLVGSLRKASWSRAIASALLELEPPGLELEIADLNGLPIYNADLEESPPDAWLALRDRVRISDAVLFVTPEHNRSVPAVLKNAIDIGSRPVGRSVWSGKPGGVISVSPGALGAFGANHHLRQSLVYLNVPTMAQPEAYIGSVAALFDDEGRLSQETTREFLRTYMLAFAVWVATHMQVPLAAIHA